MAASPRPSATGLLVTVTPSQSAFFAGELLSATITFTNNASLAPPQQSHPNRATTPRTAVPTSTGSWRPTPALNSSRSRVPSASHLGLAEYVTSHLDSDEVPPSPFIGGGGGGSSSSGRGAGEGFDRIPSDSSFASTSTIVPSPQFHRETSVSNYSGGALKTPLSAAFGPLPSQSLRSLSGSTTPIASTSRPNLPTRKGLIGKPLAPSPILNKNVGSGLYGAPRRPGGGAGPGRLLGHGRAASMAVSSPDLLVGGSGTVLGEGDIRDSPLGKSHARSRLGGSLGGDMTGLGIMEEKRKPSTGQVQRVPLPIAEEPNSPDSSSEDINDPAPYSPSQRTVSGSSHPYSHSQQPDRNFSTNSLANSEVSEAGHGGFYGLGQNETMESIYREGVEDWTRKASQEGPSSMAGYATSAGPTSTTFAMSGAAAGTRFLHPPNTLVLLWSFAHLEGTFEVDDMLVKPAEFTAVKKALLGGAGSAMGGGTLEEPKAAGSGWKDWIWGGGGGGGAGGAKDKMGGGRAGATLEERKNQTMKEKSVPTFSSPPSILGVDIVLEPGESKSYTFSIRVPADLPPSFRGKSIKFSYHLVVGSNRAPLGPKLSPQMAKESTSRIMRVPVRMYNHVGVTGARPFYDLTNPIILYRDEATISDLDDPKVVKRAQKPSTGKEDFELYAATLLDSVAVAPNLLPHSSLSPTLTPRSPTIMENPPALRPEMRPRASSTGSHGGGLDDEEGVGCKAAVEIVSRNSQKVSYDINKDGYMVASLTLVKSAYRLGETVNGSIVINSSDGRVLRFSARLETHELIETTIATKPAAQVRQFTRRLYSEHHETTIDSARVGFALAIPSGATPDFATSGVKLQWSVRLSFLVIPPSPDTPLAKVNPHRPAHGRTPSGVPQSGGAGGTPARHGRSKSFAYGFEPAVPLTLPAAPLIMPTGATHLMPILGAIDSSPSYTSYRAVPDLGFVPVLFSSSAPEPPPAPGPLQRSASGTLHKTSSSVSLARTASLQQQASVVLVPAKIETVECSIPVKVYPGNTPFRSTVTLFDA